MNHSRKYAEQVFMNPVRQELDNIFQVSEVEAVNSLGPFIKKKFVYGFTLYGTKNASDTLLNQIAETITTMFPDLEGLNREKQAMILQNIYRHGAFVPVLLDKEIDELEDPNSLIPTDFMETILSKNSVADVLRVDGSNQPIEVVEHLLHFITTLGFGYTMPDDWAFTSDASKFLEALDEAIAAGIFNISGFLNETDNIEIENFMIRKEFGYWLITTCWDVQSRYGEKTDEWTINTRSELKHRLPLAYDLFTNTVESLMFDPSGSDLDKYLNKTI